MELDYTLTTTKQRLDLLNKIPLTNLTATQLELCADYLLYTHKPQTKKIATNPKHTPLDPSIIQPTPQFKYTNPKPKVDWSNPLLTTIKQSIEQLDIILCGSTDAYTQYKLRQWKIELRKDAYSIQELMYPFIRSNADYLPLSPPEIEDYIDFTNSYHIKHIITYYSQLRQSTFSKFTIEYFDEIVEYAKLLPWEKHLLIRRIDGANQISIGIELAQQFDKIVSPSYMSQAMRAIYQKIAKAAEQKQLEHKYRDDTSHWKWCPSCNQLKLNNSYNFQKNKKQCKRCLKETLHVIGGK